MVISLTSGLLRITEFSVYLRTEGLICLVCNDIIEHKLKHKEIEDLDKRLTAIEQRLN